MGFRIRFWGVRGSIACPSAQHIRYGGNTSCLEVQVDDECIIMDAGTGIRTLGAQILKRGCTEAQLLLTHTHWDHINGFPFFAPAYMPSFTLHIRAGHLKGQGIRDVLSAQMDNPMFPVPLEAMRCQLSLEDFVAGDSFRLGKSLNVRTAPLRHPNGATGYRLEYKGKSACYVTDTEHVPGQIDENILGLIEGADVVIYDSTYTEAEFPSKIGWGHSTWNEGLRLCRAAGAKSLAIFHHDPDHDDAFMDGIAAEAKAEWSEAFVAKEGMEIVFE
ncbi:MAG: MBL fold metallo-hydrolase [Magnetospirillum sp. WYHS-4]